MLLDNVARARHRIVLTTLYVGNGPQERSLLDALAGALRARPALSVHVVLDAIRGVRGHNNSAVMLRPLVDEFGDRFVVSMYHTPQLNGLLKAIAPQRYSEAIGVFHMKLFTFDDESVILSGANMSEAYFTNRQDRYVQLSQCQSLVKYFRSVVDTIGKLSYRLNARGETVWMQSLPEPTKTPDAFVDAAHEMLVRHLDLSLGDAETDDSRANTTIAFPSLQMGQLGIRHDQFVTQRLLETPKGSSMAFMSPYFNVPSSLREHMMNAHGSSSLCEGDMEIYTASPEANGWYGASGPASYIVPAYSELERDFFNHIAKHNQDHRIRIREYSRADWTFHGKGMWYTPPGEALPAATLVGSSNAGQRSFDRDVEAQLVLITQDASLRARMQQERELIRTHTTPVTSDTFSSEKRTYPTWVSHGANIIAKFM